MLVTTFDIFSLLQFLLILNYLNQHKYIKHKNIMHLKQFFSRFLHFLSCQTFFLNDPDYYDTDSIINIKHSLTFFKVNHLRFSPI